MDRAFVYKNNKDILNKSSSGGAFLGLVESVRSIGGGSWSVYGAYFTDDFKVVHGRADSVDECEKFCGSKYVQSNLNDVLDQVAQDLKADFFVLFTGTPCQIAAVKAYIKRLEIDSAKLFLADIVCHGTPQPKFWKEWVAYLEAKNNAKLIKYSFRYKPKGWKGYPVLAEFSDGKRYENHFETSPYMNLFRAGLLMRRSCFNCKYPGNFQSDITIADFWGIELCMPEIDSSGGVSLILSHTEKGQRLIENIMPHPIETLSNDYLKYNHNLTKSTKKPRQYDSFWEDYKNKGFEYVLKKYGGYSFKGKIKFYLKIFLRDSGLLQVAKRLLRKA